MVYDHNNIANTFLMSHEHAPTSLADGLHCSIQEAGGAAVRVQVDDIVALLLPSHLVHQHTGDTHTARSERDKPTSMTNVREETGQITEGEKMGQSQLREKSGLV